MKRCVFARLVILCLMAPLSLTAADAGRIFAGRYQIATVAENGNSVTAKFMTDIQNVGTAALNGVRFELQREDTALVAQTDLIDMPPGATLRVSFEVTIDRALLMRWAEGQVSLSGHWVDGDGNRQRRPVELTKSAVPGELQ